MRYTVQIKKNSTFTRIYRKGRYFPGKYLILYTLTSSDCSSGCALGITASAKVGKSVKRNRIKRLVKENYRFYEAFIQVGFMYVFVVRARQKESLPDFYEVSREMKSLFTRAGVFDIQKWENTQNGA